MSKRKYTNEEITNEEITNGKMNNIVQQIFALIGERNEIQVMKDIKYNANFRNEDGLSIFEIDNNIRKNNILMSCCMFGLQNAALFIIRNYKDSVELGSINRQGQTALMICINNNMYLVALELLNSQDSVPELANENIVSSFDLILRKPINNEDIKTVLVKLIEYYLQYSPTNKNFHKNINIICSNKHLVELLQSRFNKDVLDFDKICSPIQQAYVSDYVNNTITPYNMRNAQNITNATPYNMQIAEPIIDTHMHFDANEYTDEQLASMRINKRLGGKKKRTKRKVPKHKKTKRRGKSHKKNKRIK
uniref:Ankyrin repeat protein n=1 Tax=viral metagenome TaxID=1070528 RepID=A0A6C0JKZ7_9ZZZZ